MLTREALGHVLRSQRIESSRTMAELARKSGISRSYILDLELGRKEASSEMLEDLCDSLDITVGDLLVGAAEVMHNGRSAA